MPIIYEEFYIKGECLVKFVDKDKKLNGTNQSQQISLKDLSNSIEHTCMKSCIENTFLNNIKLKNKKSTPYK